MTYHALVTLSLPKLQLDCRQTFYTELKSSGWKKLGQLDETWRVQLGQVSDRNDANTAIMKDLEVAGTIAGLPQLSYAFQMGSTRIIKGTLVRPRTIQT